MSPALRVVHLPARTPYVRKIASPEFSILNGVGTAHGVVPDAVTAQWLLDRRPLDWFDVLHLHHVEFDDLPVLERLLAACADSAVLVVYTAHDVSPMFCTADDFSARLALLASAKVAWIGLTEGSVSALGNRLGNLPQVTVIPHGYVVPPDEVTGKVRARGNCAPQYLLYGALRRNRDHLATIANWSLSITDPDVRLSILLRALSPVDFERHDVPALLAITKSDTRIHTTMRAYPSDGEIVAAGLQADALLLPYLFGSHSGQLELAFDLNLTPICSSVGFLKEQHRMHRGLVGVPIWFDWAEGHPFLFGEKFVAALETAHPRLVHGPRKDPGPDFLDYRREEHRGFLAAHAEIYAQ